MNMIFDSQNYCVVEFSSSDVGPVRASGGYEIMNKRRAFLKTVAAAMAAGATGSKAIARAAGSNPAVVRDAKIIRVRDREAGFVPPSPSEIERIHRLIAGDE